MSSIVKKNKDIDHYTRLKKEFNNKNYLFNK